MKLLLLLLLVLWGFADAGYPSTNLTLIVPFQLGIGSFGLLVF
jgi:hypothetical protein